MRSRGTAHRHGAGGFELTSSYSDWNLAPELVEAMQQANSLEDLALVAVDCFRSLGTDDDDTFREDLLMVFEQFRGNLTRVRDFNDYISTLGKVRDGLPMIPVLQVRATLIVQVTKLSLSTTRGTLTMELPDVLELGVDASMPVTEVGVALARYLRKLEFPLAARISVGSIVKTVVDRCRKGRLKLLGRSEASPGRTCVTVTIEGLHSEKLNKVSSTLAALPKEMDSYRIQTEGEVSTLVITKCSVDGP